jgi:hypothetical protein
VTKWTEGGESVMFDSEHGGTRKNRFKLPMSLCNTYANLCVNEV